MNTLLASLGELAIIERIRRLIPDAGNVAVGPGDDCAVVTGHGSADLLLTSDSLVEDVHFRTSDKPSSIGHKAVGRVLSDIGAMGGKPEWLLVNIEIPGRSNIRFLEAIYRGMASIAGSFLASIVGGDVCNGKKLALHVFGAGRVPKGKALLRSGARKNDIIFVTGSLGGSSKNNKHLNFTPRVWEGIFLLNWATSCIDVSDGLASDLAHLCRASGTGAMIHSRLIPVNGSTVSSQSSRRRITSALRDGEDFELLFTIPPEGEKRFVKAWKSRFNLPCSKIGIMISGPPKMMCEWTEGRITPITEKGYEHFRNRKEKPHGGRK